MQWTDAFASYFPTSIAIAIVQVELYDLLLFSRRTASGSFRGTTHEGVPKDAYWKAKQLRKNALSLTDARAHQSNPLTILAIDAPSITQRTVQMTCRCWLQKS